MKIDIVIEYSGSPIVHLKRVKFYSEPDDNVEREFTEKMYIKFDALVKEITKLLSENKKPESELLTKIVNDIYKTSPFNKIKPDITDVSASDCNVKLKQTDEYSPF